MLRSILLGLAVLFLLPACDKESDISVTNFDVGGSQMQITSTAFQEGQKMPTKYTGEGENVSPPLAWQESPQNVKSFAVISDDPDAPVGTWVHWVVYNIPPEINQLNEKILPVGKLDDGTMQGVNDFGKIGYGGPMPPKGKPHRYYFKVYALDEMLDLEPAATKSELLEAMGNHIIDMAQIMATYQR